MALKAIVVEYFDGERTRVRELLEKVGLEVVDVPFGLMAMKHCEEHHEEIDLVVVGNLGSLDTFTPYALARDLLEILDGKGFYLPAMVRIDEKPVEKDEPDDLEAYEHTFGKLGESDEQGFVDAIREVVDEQQRDKEHYRKLVAEK
jgi:hypothetical protein